MSKWTLIGGEDLGDGDVATQRLDAALTHLRQMSLEAQERMNRPRPRETAPAAPIAPDPPIDPATEVVELTTRLRNGDRSVAQRLRQLLGL